VVWSSILDSCLRGNDKTKVLQFVKKAFYNAICLVYLEFVVEPIFVPEYWSPPSLFNLNVLTGFDIESILWAFGIGGIVVVVYNLIFPVSEKKIAATERHSFRHRHHLAALLATPVILLILLITTPLNPIYSSVIAMTLGGIATWYCRPDLKKKMFVSAFLFLGVYFLYFLTLFAMSPGYVLQVWNLQAISGILVIGVPLEELLFALSFGFYWSSVFEHLTWRGLTRAAPTS